MPGSGKSEKKLCFVIGPIGDPGTDARCRADWLLSGIVKPVFKEHFPAFTVQRADEIVEPGAISSQVITRLMDAPLVIADMNFHNANAFYELAVRHMMRLPTIHLIRKDWKIPFDVAPYRAIPFSYEDYSELEKAREELKSTVTEVTKPDFTVENPITHARGRFEVDRHASPQMKVLIDTVESLRSGISQIEVEREREAVVRALQQATPAYPLDYSAQRRSFGGLAALGDRMPLSGGAAALGTHPPLSGAATALANLTDGVSGVTNIQGEISSIRKSE